MGWYYISEAEKPIYWYAILGTAILFIFSFIFSLTLLRSLTYWRLIYVIFWLGFVIFLGTLFTWKYYLAEFYTPKNLRWDKEGIEIINLFDKRVKNTLGVHSDREILTRKDIWEMGRSVLCGISHTRSVHFQAK